MPVSLPTFAAASSAARGDEPVRDDGDLAATLAARFAADALAWAGVDARSRILDAATGAGAVALGALDRGAEVMAIDPDPAAIDRLRRRLSREQRWRTSAVVMDGDELELPDEIFDLAFSLFELQRPADPSRGLRELRRVLKPGGRVVTAAWAAPTQDEAVQVTSAALRSVWPGPVGTPERAASLDFGDPAVHLAVLREAGFSDIAVRPIAHAWELPSVDCFIAHVPAVWPALRHSLAAMPAATEAAFRKILRRTLCTRFGSGPVPCRIEAHLACGTRP